MTTTECSFELTLKIPGPPVSIVTVIEISCPARWSGRTGIGVTRSASGTLVVGGLKLSPG